MTRGFSGTDRVPVLHLALALLAGTLAGVLSLLLRMPSMMAGPHAALLRALAIQHAPIMIAFSGLPGLLGGIGPLLATRQIGATGAAAPCLSAVSLILVAAGFCLCLAGLAQGGAPTTLLVALATATTGLLLCAAGLAATLLNRRRPGLGLGSMPLFAWSLLIAALLAVASLPLVAAVLTRAALDGQASDAARLGRDLAAPGFCIMVLPGLGLVCEVVAGLSGRALAGRSLAIAALAALALAGFLGWSWPLLHPGHATPAVLHLPVLALLLPVLVLCVLWAATLWRVPGVLARLNRAPGLFAAGLVATLLVGGLAALWGLAPMHGILSACTGLSLFGGFYWWIGSLSGRAYPERLGRLQFWLLSGGMLLLGTGSGRVAGQAMALGAALAALALLLLPVVVALTLLRGRPLPPDPFASGLRAVAR